MKFDDSRYFLFLIRASLYIQGGRISDPNVNRITDGEI